MPIVVDFLANVRGLLRGTKDAEQAFDDVSDVLDDIARDGKKAGDKIGDGITAGSKEADRSVEKLERSFKDMADVSKRETRQAADALAQNTSEGTSRARRDLDELGNEARQNASETFSSFDGSAESFADGIQGTLGGIVSSLGPIGAAAGAAGALGIGIIMGALANADEDTQAYKERVSELGQEFIDAGLNGEAGLDFLVDKLQELATETDSTSLKDLAKVARESGSDFQDLAQGYAGNTRGLRDLWHAADDRLAQMQQEIKAAEQNHSASATDLRDMQTKIDAQQRYKDYVGQSLGVSREAAEAERNYAAAGGPELEAKAAALDDYASGVQDALTTAGEAWEDYTHDGVLNLDEYNAAIEAQAVAIQSYQANVVTATQTLSQEALNYIMSLGPEAAPLLQAYIDAPLEQKERTAANWGVLGSAAADSYTTTLKAGIPGEIPGPIVRPRVDLDQAYADMQMFVNKNYSVGVGVLARPGSPVDQ